MNYNPQEKAQQMAYGANNITNTNMLVQSNLSVKNTFSTQSFLNYNPRASFNSVSNS